MRPGVSAALEIAGPTFDEATYVPRPAVFEVGGQSSVYLRTATGFEPRAVRVKALTSTVAVIEGLDPNLEVALVNPNKAGSAPARAAQPGAPRASS